MNTPDTISEPNSNKVKTELAIDYLLQTVPETVEGGKRYTFKFPEDGIIEYEERHIRKEKKKERPKRKVLSVSNKTWRID